MSTNTKSISYNEDFKKILVNLYQSGGKIQTALACWMKQLSTVKTDDSEVMTAKQVKDLQKRLTQLE